MPYAKSRDIAHEQTSLETHCASERKRKRDDDQVREQRGRGGAFFFFSFCESKSKRVGEGAVGASYMPEELN